MLKVKTYTELGTRTKFVVGYFVCLYIMICVNCNPHSETTLDASTMVAKNIIDDLSNGKTVIVKNKTIKGVLDFTKVYSQKQLGKVYIEPSIGFINCTFEDSVFSVINNWKCVFNKKVIFNDCKFQTGICFQNVDFKDEFSMDLSKIEGIARFDGAVFRSKASFNSVNFLEMATFSNVVFSLETSFYKSLFKKDCIFHFARFNNFARFIESYFYGYTDFSQIFSSSILDFTASKFNGETIMSYSTFLCDVIFSNCRFKQNPELQENTVLGEISFKGVEGIIPDITNNKMFNQLKFCKK